MRPSFLGLKAQCRARARRVKDGRGWQESRFLGWFDAGAIRSLPGCRYRCPPRRFDADKVGRPPDGLNMRSASRNFPRRTSDQPGRMFINRRREGDFHDRKIPCTFHDSAFLGLTRINPSRRTRLLTMNLVGTDSLSRLFPACWRGDQGRGGTRPYPVQASKTRFDDAFQRHRITWFTRNADLNFAASDWHRWSSPVRQANGFRCAMELSGVARPAWRCPATSNPNRHGSLALGRAFSEA